MEILYFFTSLFFFIWIIKNTLYWIYLWQLKEYRFDRIKVHILETDYGRNLFKSFEGGIKIFLFAAYFIVVFYENLINYYFILIFLLYLYSFLKVLSEINKKKIRLPRLTLKSFSIFSITSFIIIVFYMFPLLDRFFWLVFIDKFSVIIIFLIILLSSIPTELYKEVLIYKAIKKRSEFINLTTIGITGSYGKGSTKEFAASILAYKFNVLKSFENYNTPIGVARTMINKLNNKKELLIVEMGAYKIGEIKEICYFVKPRIGIITGISDQHMSLFGSFENILKGKYELIESLPREGTAIFNGNNQYVLEMSKKTKKKKIIYYTSYDNKGWEKYDISALNIKEHKFHLVFDVFIKEKKEFIRSLKVKLAGKHNIENLLPGIYLALDLKMKKKEIISALGKIFPTSKVMEPYINTYGTVLIDDTFNASIPSVKSALEYIKIYKGKKVFVFNPMIELGENASYDHYSVGFKAGKVCDYFISTNNNYFEDIKKGIVESGGTCILKTLDPGQIINFINSDLRGNDVVVFEGKEAGLSLKSINREKVY